MLWKCRLKSLVETMSCTNMGERALYSLMRTSWLPMVALVLALCPESPAAAAAKVAQVTIQDAIGPATSGYFEKAHRKAVESGASLVVLQIDTPGGLDSAMRDIIKTILNSPVPVACFVAPGGARAASAGTYILYACHIAAMAPATNLGAATPVPVGGTAPLPGMPDKAKDEKDKDEKDKAGDDGVRPDAMQTKIVNDAVAYIRSLAEKRGRNADWAERAVREGASLTADRALAEKVIDVIANDVPDLLKQIDGRKVTTTAGEVTLASAGAEVEKFEPDWRMKFLAIVTNPTVAYVLLLIGIYGLLLEGYHPGAILPGVVGAICLLLAMFAFQVLPVNYVGLALILLGVVLMIAEAFAPSFGVMGIGGLVAFVFGSIMLMDIEVPGYGVNRGIIGGIAAAAAGMMAATIWLVWRSRRAPVVTGDLAMIGRSVEVLEFADGEGWAMMGGERWRVRCAHPLAVGQRARVARMNGLVLEVEPAGEHG
jgi:membrane-bound serine protease (ClpP class)